MKEVHLALCLEDGKRGARVLIPFSRLSYALRLLASARMTGVSARLELA